MAQRVIISWVREGVTEALHLDCTKVETHRLSADISEHAIESGPDITDHIRPDADVLGLEAIISNTPVQLIRDAFSSGVREVDVQIDGAPKTIGNTFGRPIPILGGVLANVRLPLPSDQGTVKGYAPEFDRVEGVFQALRRINSESLLLTITTTLHEYTNMAFASIEIRRDAAMGNALALVMEAREVLFGVVSATDEPILPSVAKKTNKGPQAPKRVDGGGERESAAFKVQEALFGP